VRLGMGEKPAGQVYFLPAASDAYVSALRCVRAWPRVHARLAQLCYTLRGVCGTTRWGQQPGSKHAFRWPVRKRALEGQAEHAMTTCWFEPHAPAQPLHRLLCVIQELDGE
jgi:hypothetical protein